MPEWLVDGMIYLGSLLMVWNIYGFVRYARYVRARAGWERQSTILYIPIVLLVLFLLGYLAVGIFGRPDLIVAGILFGGSVFVSIIYWLLENITRRIIESERQAAEAEASRESSRVKNSFLASISHEMRTPMNVILGLDELALKTPNLPGKTREQLEKIGQSGKHLLGLINNTLEIQQLESGEMTAKEAPFLFRDVLEQINAIVNTLCEEKGLTFRTDIHGNTDATLIGDGMMLKQVLLSLLDNAIKFTDAPGTVTFSAGTVASEREKVRMRFSVADTGIGMSPEFLSQVFQPFTQEDGTAIRGRSGTGIGLAVTRKQAELMGGVITATSEQGKGSTFTAVIPFRVSGDAEAEHEPAGGYPPLAGRRILIVEDTAENAEIVADLLELEDAESERAENGREGLDMFSRSEEGYYDAILMDLRMPVMDGLEATRRIRALERPDAKRIPIIALSANTFESDVRHSLEAGMNEHLGKPADTEHLYMTLRKWIWKSRRGGKGQ